MTPPLRGSRQGEDGVRCRAGGGALISEAYPPPHQPSPKGLDFCDSPSRGEWFRHTLSGGSPPQEVNPDQGGRDCVVSYLPSRLHAPNHEIITFSTTPCRTPSYSVTAKGAMASMSLTQSMTTGLFALNAWSSALLSSPGFSTRMPSAPMDSAISAKFTSLSFQSS